MAETARETPERIESRDFIHAQVRLAVARLAESDCPVLILGERGAGKRFAAAQIHGHSSRSRCPFIEQSSVELEGDRMLSALDTRGTLYLVEVGDLDRSIQELLLESYFRSRNSHKCRLLFGSTRELRDEVQSSRMREDFYFMMSAVTLRIPPLRHRKSEILGMAELLLTQYSKKFDRPRPALSGEIAEFLLEHSWPENLTELQTAIKTLVAIGDQSISLAALRAASPALRIAGHRVTRSLKEATRCVSIQVERQMISDVLGSTGGNRKRAADELGISYKALLYKIRQFGVEHQQWSKESGVPR